MDPTFVTAGPLKLRVLLAFLVICMHAKQQQQQREGKKIDLPGGCAPGCGWTELLVSISPSVVSRAYVSTFRE